MSDPANNARLWAICLFAVWAAAFGGSYLAAWLTEPTDMGFTRGLNRLVIWIEIQALALIFAIVAWVSVTRRRAHLSRALVWLGRVPLLAAGAEIVVFFGLIIFALLTTGG